MGTLAEANVRGYMAKNSFGDFVSKCEASQYRTAQDIGEEGAAIARGLAPVDTGQMVGTIKGYAAGNAGRWKVGTDHWAFVEYGTSAHKITGKMSFNWAGGHFVWSRPEYKYFNHVLEGDKSVAAWVWHPGTKAQPFMQPSYEAMKPRVMAIARKNYP